jgi:hypothetical protein
VGAGTSASAGAITYSAAPPSRSIGRKPITASPTCRPPSPVVPPTPSPSTSTVPETSYPGTCGSTTGIGRKPPRMPASATLNAEAATRTRTSPAPGVGWSTSS